MLETAEQTQHRKPAEAKKVAPKVAAMFLKAVEKRLSASKVDASHARFFGKCCLAIRRIPCFSCSILAVRVNATAWILIERMGAYP